MLIITSQHITTQSIKKHNRNNNEKTIRQIQRDFTKSQNPYVNGSQWFFYWFHKLCTKCGEIFPKNYNHIWWIWNAPTLSKNENDYFRTKFNSFKKNPRVSIWGFYKKKGEKKETHVQTYKKTKLQHYMYQRYPRRVL